MHTHDNSNMDRFMPTTKDVMRTTRILFAIRYSNTPGQLVDRLKKMEAK